MPSDYAAIRGEKPENYVELAERVSEELLSRQYADRAHFVFELLQNAEDALRRRPDGEVPRRVRFMLEKGAVRFSHFGLPFDETDVRAVCEILVSTKDEETDIGHFGIGFKAVGAVTDRPEIHSGDERFAIERYVLPFKIPATDLQRDETLITLPLRDGDSTDDIARQLACLGDERTLLFLREIDEIEWSVEDGGSGSYRRDTSDEGESVRRVRLFGEVDGEETSEEVWLVFSREVYNDGRYARHVELAFRVETDKAGREVIVPVHGQNLVVFFPTARRTDVGMLVQGPYITTPSRDNVQWADERNHRLVAETADLLVEALGLLRDRRLLTARVFDTLPLSRSRFPESNPFAPLFDAVKDAVAREPLLPAHLGGPVAASRARLTPSPGLRSLVSRARLAELIDANEPVAWLSGEIRSNTTLHAYLRREHGVEEMTAASFLGSLGKRFLEAQPDGWIRRLYEFLHRERRKDAALGRALDDAYIPPLVRLEGGTHTEPEDWSGDRLFLPTEPPSGLANTVLPAVCDSEPALAFLKSLGLSEPDLVDELIPDVVPRYRDQGAVDPSAHPDDLRRIVEVFNGASRSARERLTEALRETFFVRAEDAGTGEPSFVKPRDVYLRTRRLFGLFNGVSGVLFPARPPKGVSAADMASLLEACGVPRTLAIDESEASVISNRYSKDYQVLGGLSPQERREMRRRAGREKITEDRWETVTNSQFRGLEELLERLPTLPAKEAADRAALLWDALRVAAEIPGQPGFKGTYRWFRNRQWSTRFDSASVRLLNETAWVPDGSGSLQPPSNVEFAPLGWTPDPFIESVIKFREPEPHSSLATLADEEDVDAELLAGLIDVAKRGDLTPEELQEFLSLRGRRRPREASGPQDGGVTSSGGDGDGDRQQSTSGGPDGTVAGSGVTTGGATRGGWTADGGATGGGVPAFRSRIGVERESEPTEEGSREYERRMSVQDDAIELILQREPGLKRTPPGNPGFDLYEPGTDGEPVRWVEVKALSGEWESNVTLSHTQFGLARKKGERYWLYVVEHAGTDGARIVPIQNPAGRDSTYTFDHGWRAAAEGTDGDG